MKEFFNKKINVEFSNEFTVIPYEENKKFLRFKKYKYQFIFSSLVFVIMLIIFLSRIMQNNLQEKLSKNLLNNYTLTTAYHNYSESNVIESETPFVIGIIKIDKINLIYPILSQTDDELLKISLCRYAGPMPGESGNLCIVGHNYIDNRFFGNLDIIVIRRYYRNL